MRGLVIGLAIVVGLGGLWLLRELRAPTAEPASEAPGAATTGRPGSARSVSATGATGEPSPMEPIAAGELPAPLGGVRAWSTAPAPADGPDPFAPVPTIRTEAETRTGLSP